MNPYKIKKVLKKLCDSVKKEKDVDIILKAAVCADLIDVSNKKEDDFIWSIYNRFK